MMLVKIFVSLAIILSPISASELDSSLVVNTTIGRIRGLVSEDGSYDMFLGIPYAVVDKRSPFGAARPAPIFEDTFNAFEDIVRCPQPDAGLVSSSLDCLQMNIYVPRTIDSRPLPVLVYIHGGGFSIGTSARHMFGPKFLVRHNVIYVSFHYRLSVYGFMCLHTPEVPGNQGLKDQLAALRWIKNNIRSFGGDDENITIFGESAGGVSVDLQLLFADEGLFHKVISQSGTSLSPRAILEPDVDAAFKIARVLGFETSNMTAAVEFLSNQNTTRVIVAASRLPIVFRPCLEKEFPNVERFVTTHSVNTPIPRARDIPIITGYTDDEMLMTYANMPAEVFERLDVFNGNLQLGFDLKGNHERMKNHVSRFYAGDEPMSGDLRRNVMDFESDFIYVHPAQRSLDKYLNYNGTAYHYVFSYVGGRNMVRNMLNITMGGASHADELGYLFDLPSLTETPTPDDQLTIDRITTLWTNFAKYGDPTPSTTPLLPVRWLPVTRERLHYLNLTKDIELSARPFHKRLTFWDLFYRTNKQYVRGYSRDSI